MTVQPASIGAEVQLRANGLLIVRTRAVMARADSVAPPQSKLGRVRSAASASAPPAPAAPEELTTASSR